MEEVAGGFGGTQATLEQAPKALIAEGRRGDVVAGVVVVELLGLGELEGPLGQTFQGHGRRRSQNHNQQQAAVPAVLQKLDQQHGRCHLEQQIGGGGYGDPFIAGGVAGDDGGSQTYQPADLQAGRSIGKSPINGPPQQPQQNGKLNCRTDQNGSSRTGTGRGQFCQPGLEGQLLVELVEQRSKGQHGKQHQQGCRLQIASQRLGGSRPYESWAVIMVRSSWHETRHVQAPPLSAGCTDTGRR